MATLTHELINDVFRGPVYGNHDIFTARSWARFVKQHDLDLSRALFAQDESRVVGTIAFAQRGERAWLSVMGVLPAYRRKGYGRTLFGGAVDAVRASGATHIEFEVVQRNEHARKMYESFGFSVVGELHVWARRARTGADDLSYSRRSIASVRRIVRSAPVCWQRDPLAIARAGPSALINLDGAYAYVLKRGQSAIVLDAAARDESAAQDLVRELERIPYDLTLLNEPERSPLTPALSAMGWRIVERQYRLTGS